MEDTPGEDDGFLLPVGTVTLVLADLEGSTRMWEQSSADMAAAMDELDDLVRDTIGRHGGVLPIEQGEGDSFVAAFTRASDALAATLELQRALVDRPLRLRMGLHTGEVQLRGETTYAGGAINRCARLRDAAHGGQVVLSQATAELVLDALPAKVRLIDLGTHRLRDLARPERVWQLTHPELRAEFPSLRSLDLHPHNLPIELTSFVGRERELDEVNDLVSSERLVTLTGPGGVGKTRLALQVAAERLDAHPDGVWLIELAGITAPAFLARAITDVLGLADEPERSYEDTAASMIGDRAMLLVLDNCEHVIERSADVAQLLLSRCPRLHILATSREPLGVQGETSFRVPSLATPPEDGDATGGLVEAVGRHAAIQLFVERATRARAGFALTDANAGAIAAICSRLDGIPLAIELAAARVRVLTPDQIRDGLHDRFRLLTGGARTVMPRQQTLAASVDWSYDLLMEAERTLLRRLSVFVGGFTLEAAEHVGSGGEIEPHHVLDLLSQLVDKSLVVVDDGRFRQLETVRQYAGDRLFTAGETEDVRTRARDFFVEWVPRRTDERQFAWRDRLLPDYPNLRRALEWTAERAEDDLLLRFAGRLGRFWYMTMAPEGRVWLDLALERDRGGDPVARAVALCHRAWLGVLLGLVLAAADVTSNSFSGEAQAIFDREGDAAGLAWANAITSYAGPILSSDYAAQCAEAALAAIEQIDDVETRSFILRVTPRAIATVDIARARSVVQEALAFAGANGLDFDHLSARSILGMLHVFWGHLEDTVELYEDLVVDVMNAGIPAAWFPIGFWSTALIGLGELDRACEFGELTIRLGRELGSEYATRSAMTRQAMAFALRGDLDAAVALAREAYAGSQQIPRARHMFSAVLGTIHRWRGDAESAAELLREPIPERNPSLEFWSRFTSVPALVDAGLLDEAEAATHVGIDTWATWGSAAATTPGLHCLAMIAVARADHREAARLFGAAETQRASHGRLWTLPWQNTEVEAAQQTCRAALGDDDYTAAFDEGAALSLSEAVAYVQRGRGARRRPTSGWDSLTPTELAVVDLVAAGLSNPQIGERLLISRRTVGTHLTHVFAKLGLASRTELAAAAASRSASEGGR